ncbi:MAG: aminodeoxychorismate/anthranilate synthase component II [archaeon]
MNILFIDNFDSFTYNLVDEFEKRDCNVIVFRNDISMEMIGKTIQKIKPKLIVISPGPSTPKKAGISMDIIKKYYQTIPIFGVCLGHQCIIESFGGKVARAPEIVHGKPSRISHDNKAIYKNLENPFQAGRYHSLTGIKIPFQLRITATADNIIMGVRHKKYPVEGVQFHPESILTPIGGKIIENLINLVKK